jgi:hypothetical protein
LKRPRQGLWNAIDIGTLVRLFARWCEPVAEGEKSPSVCHRVEVSDFDLQVISMTLLREFPVSRAACIEVAVRLQKAFGSLTSVGNHTPGQVATQHARLAFARAEKAMELPQDWQLCAG